MNNKHIVLLINCMMGGGAERILVFLANNFVKCGYDVTFILTQQKLEDAIGYEMDSRIEMMSLFDCIDPVEKNVYRSIIGSIVDFTNKCLFRIKKKFGFNLNEELIIKNFAAKNRIEINALKKYLLNNSDAVIIAFLQTSINIALLALRDLDNYFIASERGNPENHKLSKSATAFINRRYKRINRIVFQTKVARNYFSADIIHRGSIIPNPIKKDLPVCIDGFNKRDRIIVNFCRISEEKNLRLLLYAFIEFHRKFPEYRLFIYGDASTEEGQKIVKDLFSIAKENEVLNNFAIFPFCSNIHSIIVNYSMFVSSSDHEGLSNSMLEAMAMGLPTICTDCAPGGVKEIITNGINGIIVPTNNITKMAEAMVRIAENPTFADTLSKNSIRIRDKLSEDIIFQRWLDLVQERE